MRNKAAWSTYAGFFQDKQVSWVEEPDGLESHWRKLAGTPKTSPKLWMDAYLAAFAMAGGYRLLTTDKAFEQLKGLDVEILSMG